MIETPENLQTCTCGSTMFTEIEPVELEEGALVVYRPGSSIAYGKSVTVPVLECLVCGRFIATRTSFAGRNRLDPEVQMYARLMDVISKHNDLIRKLEDLHKDADDRREALNSAIDIGVGISEYVPDYYTKAEVDKMIAEVKKADGEQARTTSRKTTKKDSK